MNYNRKIKELEEQLEEVRDMQHNQGMNAVSKPIQQKLKEKATDAELKFMHIAKLKGLHLRFQYKINIMCKNKRRIKRFYFADFCDIHNKVIFEIDGEYHNDYLQQKKDLQRTKDLHKEGFRVFRITNAEVFSGKTTEFLYKSYLSIGVKIA